MTIAVYVEYSVCSNPHLRYIALPDTQTTAVRDGQDFVINGHKAWIGNGTQADWMCLLCNTEQDKPKHLSKSHILVPMKTPGKL